MTALRPELPPPPPRMARRPVDERGYTVPFFVANVDGKPDHRVADPRKWARCVKDGLCWLCGELLGAHRTFAIGPMCALNRITSEPPSHHECAEWAVRACPFLTRPHAHRRENDMPTGEPMGGEMIKRNPGVTLLWTTKQYKLTRDGHGGFLFQLGKAERLECYAEGRRATPEEIRESVETGLPLLLEKVSGPDELKLLRQYEAEARTMLGIA